MTAQGNGTMKRKLSTLERLIDANICYRIALDGEFTAERLRASLDRLQRKHPALRMLIREENGEFFYELDAAREIPLRVVEWVDAEHRTRECETEAYAAFPHDQPQLRVVWLRRARDVPGTDNELLVTSTHRVCDGMSMFTIVRELLQGLHSDEELTPYPAFTVQDIIGDFRDRHPWKRKLVARAINALFALIPSSRRPLVNREIRLEWSMSRDASDRFKKRCKAEGAPLHAAMLVALGEALPVLGKKHAPDWIESPIDARRGRLPILKEDMLFFGGGAFKVASSQDSQRDFWQRARETGEEMRRKIDQDIADIPGKYQFCEMVNPPSAGKLRSIVRLGDRVSRNGTWNRITFSNLGNIALGEASFPLEVKDYRIYVHSFAIRAIGIIAHALHGKLHFTYVGDEACLKREQVEALGRAFLAVLNDRAAGNDIAHQTASEWNPAESSMNDIPAHSLVGVHHTHTKSPELLS